MESLGEVYFRSAKPHPGRSKHLTIQQDMGRRSSWRGSPMLGFKKSPGAGIEISK